MDAGEDDRTLMLRYRSGDADAFEQLYRRHRMALFRYCLRQCHGAEGAADDLFQDVWLRVIRARERYEPTAQFATWLYRIARNCVIDRARRERVRPVVTAAELGHEPPEGVCVAGDPESGASAAQAAGSLEQALAALPDEQREAFLLREEGGLSVAEIGDVQGVGAETAKSRLRYAVARLKEALSEPEQRPEAETS